LSRLFWFLKKKELAQRSNGRKLFPSQDAGEMCIDFCGFCFHGVFKLKPAGFSGALCF